MKNILLPVIGLLVLILAACTGTATQTPLATNPPTEIAAPPTETSQPLPSDTAAQPNAAITETATSAPGTGVSFVKDVMPMLNNNCTKCHGVDEIKKGLDMTSYDKLMAGSFDGPVVVAGDANQSLLVDMLVQGKMPKRGDKLTPGQIQVIINWINAGALDN